MKKNKLFVLLFTAGVLFVTLAGCNQNMPTLGYVDLQRVEINDAQLASGVILEAGKTLSIARKVVLTPANATERVENYTSDDPTIASVDAYGNLKGIRVGNTTVHITVGGLSVSFDVEITPKIIIPATDLQLPSTEIELPQGLTYNLAIRLTITPTNSNDEIYYVSSDEGIVTASETGVLRGIALGDAEVTVTTETLGITRTLRVKVVEFTGWYPREEWTMEFSQDPLPVLSDANESRNAAIDSNASTKLALVRVGKNTAGYNLSKTDDVWFVIDMQEAQKVNTFQVEHRPGSSLIHTRWWGFDYIAASNDPVADREYEILAENLYFPNSVSQESTLSNEIRFLATGKNDTPAYRFYKFYAQTANCFYQNDYGSSGLTAQMQEIYLGLFE